MSTEGEAIEAQARDRVVRFVAAVLDKLPRDTVEACRQTAAEGTRYSGGELLRDSYAEQLVAGLLAGWHIRDLVEAKVRERHGNLVAERDRLQKRNERLERVIGQFDEFARAAEAFKKLRAEATPEEAT